MSCTYVMEQKNGKIVTLVNLFGPLPIIGTTENIPEIDEDADAASDGTLRIFLEPDHKQWDAFKPGNTYEINIDA